MEDIGALLGKGSVPHREYLVDQHDVGIGLDHDREGEADHHSAGVVLQLEVDELVELGELQHRGQPARRLPAGEPHHHAVERHVLPRCELRVEADPQLDERRQPARDGDRAAIGAVDAGQDLQQRALARAVAAHDPEELALVDVKGDAAERVQLTGGDPRERMDDSLLERVDLAVGNVERLAHVADPDDDRSVAQAALAA
jgi:hypothetical protein